MAADTAIDTGADNGADTTADGSVDVNDDVNESRAPIIELEVAWPSSERHGRAMGTDIHVLVVGPQSARRLQWAIDRIAELEQRWSRFVATSEVSELNRRAGHPVAVSPDTLLLVERAILANRLTGGRFDATLGNDLIAIGYDRPFDQVLADPTPHNADGAHQRAAVAPDERADQTRCNPPSPSPSPSLSVDAEAGTATVATGLRFDPGGIGKGLAADLIVEELMADGAWGALVNLGGDLRVGGNPPSGPNWVVSIDHPHRGALRVVELVEGGLATSTTLRRRWPGPTGTLNHLLDPATRRPHHHGADFVSVIANQAWWAEAAATALIGTPLAAGSGSEVGGGAGSTEPPSGCAALLVEGDGAAHRLGPFAEFERPPT